MVDIGENGEDEPAQERDPVRWGQSEGLAALWLLVSGNVGMAFLLCGWLACLGLFPWRHRFGSRLRHLFAWYVSVGAAVLAVMPLAGVWSWAASWWGAVSGCGVTAITLASRHSRPASGAQRWRCVGAGVAVGLHAVFFEFRRHCIYHNDFDLAENTCSTVVAAVIVVGLAWARPWAWVLGAVFCAWSLPTVASTDFAHESFDPPGLYVLVSVLAPVLLATSFRACNVNWRHLLLGVLTPCLLFLVSLVPWTFGIVPEIGEGALMGLTYLGLEGSTWCWRAVRKPRRCRGVSVAEA